MNWSLRDALCVLVGSLGLLNGCAARCLDRTDQTLPTSEPMVATLAQPPRASEQPLAAIDPTSPLCSEVLEDASDTLMQPCRVIGVYTLDVFLDAGGSVFDVWPVIHLETGGKVLLESIWFPEKKHDSATVDRYAGRRVEVFGVPHRVPPLPPDREGLNNYAALPCLSPVLALRVLESE